MNIFVPSELHLDDKRVVISPSDIKVLVDKGASFFVQTGLGQLLFEDREYLDAGAQLVDSFENGASQANIVLSKRATSEPDIPFLTKGTIHISLLDPFSESETLDQLQSKGIRVLSLHKIPRSTLAQKMDVLSSQANLAGYYSVVLASQKSDKVLPMMVTPAGTLSPCKILVIGVGVAGLQAIATARRLGARVEAFDTRPAVEEQVMSLGAKFVKADLGEMSETDQGYAQQLTDEQLNMQRDVMKKRCIQSDIVITAAQVFGKSAPVILTDDILKDMLPGSIVIDLAIDSGGNVEGAIANEDTTIHDVIVTGLSQGARFVPYHSSQMFSSNVKNLLLEFWSSEIESFDLGGLHSDILKESMVEVSERAT